MEYSRRRRRRRKTAGGGGGAGRAALALVMLAAIVYLVSASKAGTWLAEKVVAPVFETIDARLGGSQEPDPLPEPEPQQSMEVSLSADEKNSESADLTLPAVNCFALQMGVFSSKSNADAQSASLQAMGAGGYILEDEGRYRVIAAGYANEADAVEVKDRLSGEGMDCTLYNIQAASATFRVSALSEQLDDVARGFEAISNAQTDLCQAALAFDKERQEVAAGKAAAAGILDRLNDDMAVLSGLSGGNATLSSLDACYKSCASELETLAKSDAERATDFSSQIKRAQLRVTKLYADLLSSLGV